MDKLALERQLADDAKRAERLPIIRQWLEHPATVAFMEEFSRSKTTIAKWLSAETPTIAEEIRQEVRRAQEFRRFVEQQLLAAEQAHQRLMRHSAANKPPVNSTGQA